MVLIQLWVQALCVAPAIKTLVCFLPREKLALLKFMVAAGAYTRHTV